MVTPEQKQILIELGKTNYGKALFAYLDEQLEELRDIQNLKPFTVKEGVARQHACKIIEDIFSIVKETPIDKRQKNLYV